MIMIYNNKATVRRPSLWHTCAAGVRATFDVDCTHLNNSGVKKKNIYKDIERLQLLGDFENDRTYNRRRVVKSENVNIAMTLRILYHD